MKTALITGINGMDGSHMADVLLDKGYTVYGLERRTSTKNRVNTAHLEDKICFITGDLSDQNSLTRAIEKSNPDEVYNFAAQSFVGESWNTPEQTGDITGLGVLRILEAIRQVNPTGIKFYNAGSSEMFGKMFTELANESTDFYPRSPYGIAKVYAYWITKNYRESYGMFNCSGILFNHESERRGIEFVTRKITNGVAKIYLGLSDKLILGNLYSQRDWGYAPEYVEAAWRMLQQDLPDDYVIATGESHTVLEFCKIAFSLVDLDYQEHVVSDTSFIRPAEVDYLKGDYSKANKVLGWSPKTTFEELIEKMVINDIKLLKGQK